MSKNRIKVTEMDKINQQANNIAGLSHVCAMYLAFTGENNFLQNALECLMNEAFDHQDYCNLLLDKLSKQ